MLFFLLSLISDASALEAEIVDHLKQGTVFLRVEGGGEASGFFVSEELVLTNRHVVEALGVGGTLEVILDSGTSLGAEVVGRVAHLAAEKDLALVEVQGTPSRVLSFDVGDLPHETESVVAVGFPMGSVRTLGDLQSDPPVSLRPGAVTSLHWARDGEPLFIEHNANMQTGSSGGALVNEQGQVVGVNVAMLREDQTTKLAIPARVVLDYLSHWRERPSRLVEVREKKQSYGETLRDLLAEPFGTGRVQDLALTPDGRAYVLSDTGEVFRVTSDGSWEDIGAGSNNADISVDDLTGDLYVVESDRGRILLRGEESRWRVISEGPFTGVVASAGRVWALDKAGAIHLRVGEDWSQVDLPPMESMVACGGLAMPFLDGRIWGVNAHGEISNGGKELATGLQAVSCYRNSVYVLQQDGSIMDVREGRLVQSIGRDAVGLYAIPDGLLIHGARGRLTWVEPGGDAPSKIQAIENP